MKDNLAFFFFSFFAVYLTYCATPLAEPVRPDAKIAAPQHQHSAQDALVPQLRQMIFELQKENEDLKARIDDPATVYNRYYYETFAKSKAELELEAFKWQRATSTVLTWIVVLFCSSGIIFSGFQLWKSSQRAKSDLENGGSFSAASSAETTQNLTTKLELSRKGVVLDTSVVGLAVLLISVVYLYVFIEQVYKVRISGSCTGAVAQDQESNQKR